MAYKERINPKTGKVEYSYRVEEQQVIDYFGHTDTEMLKSIYAKITKEQKAKRMANTFAEYFKPEKSLEQTRSNNTQTRLIERMKGQNVEAEEKRKERVFKQIENAIKKAGSESFRENTIKIHRYFLMFDYYSQTQR